MVVHGDTQHADQSMLLNLGIGQLFLLDLLARSMMDRPGTILVCMGGIITVISQA